MGELQEKTDEKGKISDEKILLDECRGLGYNTRCQCDGLSPNGKATDSDSVIVKVRILLAQLKIRSFLQIQRTPDFFIFTGSGPSGHAGAASWRLPRGLKSHARIGELRSISAVPGLAGRYTLPENRGRSKKERRPLS